ncbi:MAG: hypothetical protein AUJ12_03520 [Alphaproteobacteria bacterium CG1_02_46_17]|nr:MAG: hypothetical protein AUJ12_03520 [Alphaproteobacteria bacterium CG1_02_46_17]
MFFPLSKILWMIFQPLTFVLLMVMAGVVLIKFRIGRFMLLSGCFLFIIFGFLPIGHNILCYLENTYPANPTLPEDVDGIIVLGGAIDTVLTFSHAQVQLNENAERITEMVRLSRFYPKAKIVFAGGDGSLSRSLSTESTIMNTLLKNIGFNTGRIIYEDQSRNTYENYLYSVRLVHPQAGEKWVLVTSAFHLPRASAIFMSNGWSVIPYPAGFITDGKYRIMPNLDVLGNYYKLQVAAKEIVGIIAYTLTERIKTNVNDV